MIGFIGTSITITTNYDSSELKGSMTRSIPYWTTSVFSSTATYDERWLTVHTLNFLLTSEFSYWVWVLCYDRRSAGQSVSE
jgi:hypothetical protein